MEKIQINLSFNDLESLDDFIVNTDLRGLNVQGMDDVVLQVIDKIHNISNGNLIKNDNRELSILSILFENDYYTYDNTDYELWLKFSSKLKELSSYKILMLCGSNDYCPNKYTPVTWLFEFKGKDALNELTEDELIELVQTFDDDDLDIEYYINYNLFKEVLILKDIEVDYEYFNDLHNNQNIYLKAYATEITNKLIAFIKQTKEYNINSIVELVEYISPIATISIHNSKVKRVQYLIDLFYSIEPYATEELINAFVEKFEEELDSEYLIDSYNHRIKEEAEHIKNMNDKYPNYLHN